MEFENITLSVSFETLYSLNDNGIGYFLAKNKENEYPFSWLFCTGAIKDYNKGYPLTITGSVKMTASGKYKCIVSSYEEDLHNGKALYDFLISYGEGIGPNYAKKLVDLAGENRLLDLIDAAYKRESIASDVKIPLAILDSAYSMLADREASFELFQLLYSYGVPDKLSKLEKYYGLSAIDVIKSDPYRTLMNIDIPFYVADELAFFYGISDYDNRRMWGITKAALKCLLSDGSTYTELDAVYKKAMDIAETSIYATPLPKHKVSLILDSCEDFVVDDAKRVSLYSIRKAEEVIVKEIRRLNLSTKPLPFDKTLIPTDAEVEYGDEQIEVFKSLTSSGIKILTGGPGTGKTTLLSGIIKTYKKMCPLGKIKLCAPTGMAAENLSLKTGEEASTIHRLLQFKPFSISEETLVGKTMPIDADFVVVDECSMIDTELMAMLLKSIPSGAYVLLVGDVDQIDCVGYGMAYRDMIDSDTIPTYRLTKLYRQKAGSGITLGARNVLDGKTPEESDDFSIIEYENEEELKNKIVDCDADMILSPTKKGYAGTRELNKAIQIAKTYADERTLHRYGYVYHIGDRIVILKNDYDLGIVNGDIGFIKDFTIDNSVVLTIRGNEVTLPKAQIKDIAPAYAITVHKAQGSEYDKIAIVLPEYVPFLLDKSLLYTAITRGKKEVSIFIRKDKKALKDAITNDRRKNRKTLLFDMLKAG